MKNVIALVVGFLLVVLNVSAQKVYSDAPVVPIEVAMRGRQAVTSFLTKEVYRVHVTYSGRSVVGQHHNDRYLELPSLEAMGYTHRGQFTELSDALSNIEFNGQVMQMPDGQYEVYVNILAYTSENRLALSGAGYLDIRRNSNGTLTGGVFEPWLGINYQIQIQADNIQEAKWLGPNWEEQYLEIVYNQDGTRGFLFPIRLLERGSVMVADTQGEVTGWDLANGGVFLRGKEIRARLGQVRSSDMKIVRDDQAVDAVTQQFYKSEGKIYGRFPLLDVVTDGRKELVNPQVPVWGSTNRLSPSRMFVTPIYVNDPRSPLVIGTEYELQRWEDGQGFILILPVGGYHIRSEFDEVLDWDADENVKG